ncbi:MAG: 50S ribosomal protein L25 [candidate division Zixibacteria bacterium]|jgi:large subunit ribosomal protein L25|nr:50S ribosomal protein L25 [candidate division Zixibacteria bacterium]
MKETLLEAEIRAGSGKSVTRKLRMSGMLPAVLYGMEKEPQMLNVNGRELTRLLHAGGGENVLVDLVVGKANPEKVLVKEVQHHPVTSKIVHIDFLRIDLTKKVTVMVPVHIVGTAEGVKGGGVLEVVSRELEVSCLPMDIPSHIAIDVTALKINDAIHVADLQLGKLEILTDKARTVVTVQPPTVIKEVVPVAEAVEGAVVEGEVVAEPEVIKEKKKEKEEEPEKGKKK